MFTRQVRIFSSLPHGSRDQGAGARPSCSLDDSHKKMPLTILPRHTTFSFTRTERFLLFAYDGGTMPATPVIKVMYLSKKGSFLGLMSRRMETSDLLASQNSRLQRRSRTSFHSE